MHGYRSIAPFALLLLGTPACGDDDATEVDSGTDASQHDGHEGGDGHMDAAAGRDAEPDDREGSDTQSVTIRFQAKLGSDDLHCGQEYTEMGKSKVRATPQDFRFFVESVALIDADGGTHPVVFDDRPPFQNKDVALLDFTDREGMCVVGGAMLNTEITGKVPRGEYTGIEFVNGVPESLNHQNLTEAMPPLQDASTHWGWASGYRFIMTSVVLLDPPATAPPAEGGAPGATGSSFVHVGSSGCTGNPNSGFMCSRPARNRVRLSNFDPEKNVIVADLGAAFTDIDLAQALECHGPAPECAAAYAAFGVDLPTGSPLDSQQVYRVE